MNKIIILCLALAIIAFASAQAESTTLEPTTAGPTTTSTTTPGPDPPCTKAGYFKSNTPGKYYRCVWSSANGGRWIRYVYTCPAGQNFNEATQKCAA